MYIESLENKKVKLWTSLLTKKGRLKEKNFLLESIRGIEEGIKAGIKPEALIVEDECKIPNEIEKLEIPTYILSENVFKKLSQTINTQGIIGVYNFLTYKFKDLLKGKFLFLDGIQDPGNLGTIIRTGAALGINGLILGPGCVELYNEKVLRSSLGGVFSLPIIGADYEDLNLYKKNGFKILGMDLTGKNLKGYTFEENVVIVIGNENKGISEKVKEYLDESLNITIEGSMESLNASVAAAIVMFELIS